MAAFGRPTRTGIDFDESVRWLRHTEGASSQRLSKNYDTAHENVLNAGPLFSWNIAFLPKRFRGYRVYANMEATNSDESGR